MGGCPLGVDIPEFIRLLREGNVAEAYRKIKEQNCLAAICGRICSAPCESACVLEEEDAAIGIRALERYASDYGRPSVFFTKKQLELTGKKAAVVGSGPAGLAAAAGLAKKGYRVTVFEAFDKPGGVLRYGVPEFRVPKKILDNEINEIKAMGVKIETTFFVGKTATLEEINDEGFAAILLATGAGIPKFMDIPGTNLGGVYYGEEFLMRVNLTKVNAFSHYAPSFIIGRKIAVIGSGNTAMDCARAAARFGRSVILIFRRTEGEMPVRKQEKEYAKQEGVNFEPLVRPKEIISGRDNFVGGLKCIRMDYADVDSSGKWRIVEVPGSEFVLDVDTVIIAAGHIPNSLIGKASPKLKFDKDGTIRVDEATGMTSIEGIFAAGNIVTNAGPLVKAIASGKKAADQIDRYLK